MVFDWQEKVQFLRANPRYNNAALFGVKIEAKKNSNWKVAVYHLTADENRGHSLIHIEVLCKQDDRQGFRAVLWGSEEMTPAQLNQIGAIFADKPAYEIKTHPIGEGQRIWLEVAGGDLVKNLNAMPDPPIPNEPANDGGVGNALHRHSYLVLFQEVDKSGIPTPEPDPLPDPEPLPEPEPPTEDAVLMIKKTWFDGLTTDEDGYVRIYSQP